MGVDKSTEQHMKSWDGHMWLQSVLFNVNVMTKMLTNRQIHIHHAVEYEFSDVLSAKLWENWPCRQYVWRAGLSENPHVGTLVAIQYPLSVLLYDRFITESKHIGCYNCMAIDLTENRFFLGPALKERVNFV